MSKHIIAQDYGSAQEVFEDLDEKDSGVTAFVVGDDDKLVEAPGLADFFVENFRNVVSAVDRKQAKKTASNQNMDDLVGESVSVASSYADAKQEGLQYIEPPYPPELLEAFMEVDEVNYRCIATKATDTVNRGYMLESTVPVLAPSVKEDADKESAATEYVGETVTAEAFQVERSQAETFIDKCNEIIGFEGVLKKGALDYEGIGWAAFEVIRSMDGKIKKLEHIPAVRLRVLKGHKGFVELIKKTEPPYTNGTVVFYQPFGHKILSKKRKKPANPAEFEPYDPDEDGELGPANIQFNLRSRNTYEKVGVAQFHEAANEVLWVPKVHNKSIYYGVPDSVPAAGFIFSKVHIRDFLLQFFENNTVPRYAVVVEGSTVDGEVVTTIENYFKTHIKGRPHKTLVIGVPHKGGRTVTVRFEKLQSDEQEGSFQKTRQNDSQGIMVAHGVSPAIIGIHEAASLGSGKGLSQAEIYKDRIVTPNQNLWGRMLTRLLRIGLGLKYLRLKFDPLDIRDREAEQRVFEGYARRGAMSINEIIKEAGLGEPIPGGNRPFIQLGKEVVFVDELEERFDTKKVQEREDKQNAEKAAQLAAAQDDPSKNLENKNTDNKNSEKDSLDNSQESQ